MSAALGSFAEIKAVAVTVPRRYTGRAETAFHPRLHLFMGFRSITDHFLHEARTAVSGSVLVAFPLCDLALDGFGDIGAQQPADVLGDRDHQLGACTLRNRLQTLRELIL